MTPRRSITAVPVGGVRFALLEDRTCKSPPPEARDGRSRLLGERRLAFLREWAGDGDDEPHVCLIQTPFACAQTTPEGDAVRDYDADGYPKAGRERAVEALGGRRRARPFPDQHLGTLLRQEVDAHTDGWPYRFPFENAAGRWGRRLTARSRRDGREPTERLVVRNASRSQPLPGRHSPRSLGEKSSRSGAAVSSGPRSASR